MQIHFADGVWLFVGVVLVALGGLMFGLADRRRRRDLALLAHPRFQRLLVSGWSPALRWTRRGLWLGAVLAMAIAAARPQYGYEWREVKRRGIDILFAVDTSQSMLAEDLAPNRLERARLGIIDFLGKLRGDRVGLIPFAGTAFPLCPLTLDYDAFLESLNSLDTNLIPHPGTDVASAIREADQLFDQQGNNHRFLVLITDGEDLEGEALVAAKESAENGMTIYSIGVGSAQGERIPLTDAYGRETYLRDATGTEVLTKLDEKSLTEIAEATGGLYVPLGRGAEGLEQIYQKRLALAPKSEFDQQLEKIPLERFQWPLGFSLLLLALQMVLGERKPMPRRRPLVSASRRARPAILALLLGGSFATDARANAVADYNAGTKAFEAGEYEISAAKLKSALATPDLWLQQKSYYNLGNALFRQGQANLQDSPKRTLETWEQALKAYADSLALDPSDDDAIFNRNFIKRKIEELKQQQEKSQQDQEDSQESQESEQEDGGSQEGGAEDEEKPNEPGDDGKSGEETPADGTDPAGGSEQGDPGDEETDSQSSDAGDQSDETAEEASGEDPTSDPGDTHEEGQSAAEREGAQQEMEGETRELGEMSREEAIRLLQSLSGKERMVLPAPLSERNRARNPNRGTGKNW